MLEYKYRNFNYVNMLMMEKLAMCLTQIDLYDLFYSILYRCLIVFIQCIFLVVQHRCTFVFI